RRRHTRSKRDWSSDVCSSDLMIRLYSLISNLSQVLEPSPHGDLRVVMRRCLVGRRTGPRASRFRVLAASTNLVHTESKDGGTGRSEERRVGKERICVVWAARW